MHPFAIPQIKARPSLKTLSVAAKTDILIGFLARPYRGGILAQFNQLLIGKRSAANRYGESSNENCDPDRSSHSVD